MKSSLLGSPKYSNTDLGLVDIVLALLALLAYLMVGLWQGVYSLFFSTNSENVIPLLMVLLFVLSLGVMIFASFQ